MAISFLLVVLNACKKDNSFNYDFNNVNDRVWVGPDFWAVPLEDWKVESGRLHCVGNRPDMRLNILTHTLNGNGEIKFSLSMGLLEEKEKVGTAGICLGLQDQTDNDVRSLCYFGSGLELGVSTDGFVFIGQQIKKLPDGFNFQEIEMAVKAEKQGETSKLEVSVKDLNGTECLLESNETIEMKGLMCIFNNMSDRKGKGKASNFWFDDISISGSMLEKHPENRFGPILWTMYTLSEGVMKLTAQMPPLGLHDEQNLALQMKGESGWKSIATGTMEASSRVVTFRCENWDATSDHAYRVVYQEKGKDGTINPHYYEGKIRRDPIGKDLTMGALTCQYHYGFPYRPLYESLNSKDPDILYFSGDQIYEPNGGYGIIRFPADQAILNYLGKWYMFGWAFGDLMRDRPTICIPDDHEVYQGNLWGNSGEKVTEGQWRKGRDCISGFVQPSEMINVVMQTNSSHLPDPYDPTPMQQGIQVYYTDLVYGRVSFAVVGDRLFKSGPQMVEDLTKGTHWRGRKDMLTQSYHFADEEEERELKFLGDRQMQFLAHWTKDWQGADMKVLLSQTIFANNVTHYGPTKEELAGDLDSGGWPKSGRDKTVNLIRKCFAFHICGDQHLPSLVQYGVDDYKDGSWAFCTPAIAVGYQRRFQPDRLGKPVYERPQHNLPNTGCYDDGIGNKSFVYAVGNPDDNTNDLNRYARAQKCASGYGFIRFDKNERTITANAFRFHSGDEIPSSDQQFPGWPHVISQLDNYGREATGYLPEIKIPGVHSPVIEVINEATNVLEHIVRVNGDRYRPIIFNDGLYTVKILHPESGNHKVLSHLKRDLEQKESIEVDFTK